MSTIFSFSFSIYFLILFSYNFYLLFLWCFLLFQYLLLYLRYFSPSHTNVSFFYVVFISFFCAVFISCFYAIFKSSSRTTTNPFQSSMCMNRKVPTCFSMISDFIILFPVLSVENIFCSFIIIFIFVIPCLHKHLSNGEWMYGCWIDALITWSPLKFIIIRYSFGFSMSRFV